MKRLINPAPNGGVPYQNSDFNDIIQYSSFNGLKQYYEFLCKEMNVSSLILNGFRIVGTGSNSFIVDTTNTFIYMNGEILNSSSSGTISISSPFYLYENTPTYESRQLRSNDSANVIINRTWTFSTSDPGGNTTYSLGSTNSKLTFNLSSSSIRGYLDSELKGYLRPEIDANYFGYTTSNTYNGSFVSTQGPLIVADFSNNIYPKPYRESSITWEKPYVSFIGRAKLGGDINPIDATFSISIPNQGTTNYIVNGTLTTDSPGTIDNIYAIKNITWGIYDKNSTSFKLTLRENQPGIVSTDLVLEFSIIKNNNNIVPATCSVTAI